MTAVFYYSGLNQSGELVRGEIVAKSSFLAKSELLRQGILVRKIVKKRHSLVRRFRSRITSTHICLFTRQLAALIESGISVVKALSIVRHSQMNLELKRLIRILQSDVEAGFTLSAALKKHPRYFNELYCNLVHAGEESGALVCILKDLALYKEKMESIKKNIQKILIYPVCILIVALIISLCLLVFVIPQFDLLFQEFKADLPFFTQKIVQLSKFVQDYFYFICVFCSIIFYALFHAKNHCTFFAKIIDKILLHIPLIGAVFKKASIARFTRTLTLTYAASLPLVDALKYTSAVTGNLIFTHEIDKMRSRMIGGQAMHDAMKCSDLFPHMFVEMVAIGEESGSLEFMLQKITKIYEEDVDQAIHSFHSLLEPIMISLLGILIGGLVVAMYLPLFRLGQII